MKGKLKISIHFVALFAFCSMLMNDFAIQAQIFIPKITKITNEKGVSPGATFAIVKDSLGFIWFGTVEGLYRYDGYNFKTFRNQKDNPNSLSNNTIRSLFLDRNGKLWIATQGGGVDCLNTLTEEFTHYYFTGNSQNEISGNSVWTVFEDHFGNIWIGVAGKGVDKLDVKTKKFTHYRLMENETADTYEIRSIAEDKFGNIWVGNASYGLFMLNPSTGKVTNFAHNDKDTSSISSNGIFHILKDTQGKLWICTYGGGLNLFDYETKSFRHFYHNPQNSNSLISNLTYSITEKPGVGYWISTETGISFMDKNLSGFTNYFGSAQEPNSMTDNRIRVTYFDNQGILWIGNEIGVDKLVEQDRFMVFKNQPSNPNSLENGIVRAILEDNENNLWIGLIDKGLVKYNRKTGQFKSYKHDPSNPNSISGNHVTSLCIDSNNNIWIGEWDNGLIKYNRDKDGFVKIASTYNGIDKLSDNRIQVIKEEKPGVLWLGTEGGINKIDTKSGKITYFKHDSQNKNSLSANGIQSNAFVKDSRGNLWVGMWSAGLNKIEFTDENREKAKYTSWVNDLTNKNSLNNNNVIALYLDNKSEILWIGTYGGGLNKFDIKTGKFSHYTTDDGLPDNIIYSILEDKADNLWMSTDKGICKFNTKTGACQNFDHTDGLQDDHFFWGSSFKSKSGELFFGGINGFNSFYPEKVKTNKKESMPIVLSIKVFDETIGFNYSCRIANELNLDYNQNFLTFEFSALDYIEPQKNSYMYVLEGVDQAWNNAGNRRFATYTGIGPGSYTFRLKVANSDGEWNKKELIIKINIKPPWWETIWARGLFLIVIMGVVILIYYLRINLLERQKHNLEQQVEMRTNEILEKNLSLKQKNEEILTQKDTLSEQTARLNEKNAQLEKALAELEIAQKALIESEKMASLGTLSAGIAHEINNPLNFITLSLENIGSEIENASNRKEMFETSVENIKLLLEYANTGTSRISNIVESLKFYSHSGLVKMQNCDVEQLINNSVLIIRSKIPSYISLDLRLEQGISVNCKPDQISQVIINIIDNAIHAISEKSEKNNEKIIISSSIGNKEQERFISIQVKNTGPLLEREVLSHIFEPFYTTKEPNQGTGLGLYLSYNIIKDHQGQLIAENLDQMATFTILIPFN